MTIEKILKVFRKFMSDSGCVWDADNEIDYIKNLAYRDGAIDFCSRLLEEAEMEQEIETN